MNAVFDTLAYSKKLQIAGVPKQMAEAQAEALAEVAAERLATNDDVSGIRNEIAEVRRDLSSQIAEVRRNLSHEIAEVRKDLSNEIAKVRKDLSHKIAGVRSELKSDIADVRKDMISLEERLSYKIETVTYQLTIRLGSLLTGGIVLVGMLHKLFN